MVSVASLLNPIPLDPRTLSSASNFRISSSPPSNYNTNSPYQFTNSPRPLSSQFSNGNSNSNNNSPSLYYASPRTPGATVARTYASSQLSRKQKMVKDGAVFAKGKIKGNVNFPPYEDWEHDPASAHLVQKFSIWPSHGNMQDYARHIPYNSEKKSFLDKTGRESFEVFQYIFKLPGDDKEFTVMWDYNIGLVRITPFFKCLKYSKTTPAKMLNSNPGLKEITHSITGGALAAQGYWMPYSCAKAICQTFCDPIAGSLIPIFGPEFPSLCVPSNSAVYARFIIDPAIIAASTLEAKRFLQHYSSAPPSSFPTPMSSTPALSAIDSVSPRSQPLISPVDSNSPSPQSAGDYAHANYGSKRQRRLRLRQPFANTSSNSADAHMGYSEQEGSSPHTPAEQYIYSPITPASPIYPPSTQPHLHHHNGWSPLAHKSPNMQSESFEQPHLSSMSATMSHRNPLPTAPNPFLSAVPRSVITHPTHNTTYNAHSVTAVAHTNSHPHSLLWRSTSGKRRLPSEDEAADADAEYDGEESNVGSPSEKQLLHHGHDGGVGGADIAANRAENEDCVGRNEKNAAWLLMQLSVGDVGSGNGNAGGNHNGSGLQQEKDDGEDGDGPRVKRRRAISY